MKRTFLSKKLPLLVLVSGLVLTVAFAQTTSGSNRKSSSDTIPRKQKQIRDLDEVLLEIDNSQEEIRKAMSEIDWEKMNREIREATKNLNVDLGKMHEELAKAMKEIDMQKITAEMQKGLAEAQKAMKEIDGEKLKREIEQSLASVDMEKVKAEMQAAKDEMKKVKELDLSKMKIELEGLRPEIEKSLQEAKKSIEKAKQEIQSYKNLVNALENDGHLKKDGEYTIEYKSGALTVNGKTLSSEETKKYSEFLSGKENFTLKKNADGLNINNDK